MVGAHLLLLLLRPRIDLRKLGGDVLHARQGIDSTTAASWASLFYVGITVGRAASGFISIKVRDHNMIRLGQVLVAVGIALIALPLGDASLLAGLVLVGLGCAPI